MMPLVRRRLLLAAQLPADDLRLFAARPAGLICRL